MISIEAKMKVRSRKNLGFILVMSLALVVIPAFVSYCVKTESTPMAKKTAVVKTGLDVLLKKHLDLLKGKKVGLITNPTGVNRDLQHIMDLFVINPSIDLVSLYGPEHGVRGSAQAGQYVPYYMDEIHKIPVFSLYGQSLKPDPGMLKNMDEYMRNFDTTDSGKILDPTMAESVDIMVFDIQDIGTRIYTYIATMAYSMEVCAENGIPFIVLDRPNPINGSNMEGPILEYPEFSSFVGLFPIPVRHGMTAGELALLFNDHYLETKADLTVIPLQGWKRSMWFDETGLPWVIPSPNMPSLDTATVYPGQVFLEGTNVSEGRGTTKPFELFGAPWIDGNALCQKLNTLQLSGVAFREAWFTPTFSKYSSELCGGCQIHVLDRSLFQPFLTSLYIIHTVRDLYPDKFLFHKKYFDQIMGTSRVRKALEEGSSIQEIMLDFSKNLKGFSDMRKSYLLYE